MTQRLSEILTRTDEPIAIPPTKLFDIIQEAVRKTLIATQLLAMRLGPSSIPGDSIDIPLQIVDSITVNVIAEGQEFPLEAEALEKFALRPIKYGMKVAITREMQEDSKWDLMQRNLEYGGYKMAEKLDALVLAEIEVGSDAQSNMVTGGTAITIRNITDAMLKLESNGYNPTDLILGPEPASDIRNIDTFVEANKSGVMDPTKSLIGTIFGMKVWVSRNINNVEYAYLIDKEHALVLAEKRPITIGNFDDVHRDLSGITLSARWDQRYLRKEACAHIELSYF